MIMNVSALVSSYLFQKRKNYIITKGDVDSVYSRCQYVQHKGQTLKIDTADSGGIHAIVDEMTEDGMKVLAVAYKPVSSQSRLQMEDEAELILLGYVVFFDAPKSSAASALQKLEQLHVQVKVLTGDQKSVTLSICRRLGIETEHILTGEEMEELSEDDKLTVNRARKIQRFLSQPFHVAENFTGVPGKYVPVKETIRGFKAIIDGEMDEYPEAAFFNVGTIDEVAEKAKTLEHHEA